MKKRKDNMSSALVLTKAPPGKFRVIADNFGAWKTEHSDIHVGDFDTIEEAYAYADAYLLRPYWEHWSVTVFDGAGAAL